MKCASTLACLFSFYTIPIHVSMHLFGFYNKDATFLHVGVSTVMELRLTLKVVMFAPFSERNHSMDYSLKLESLFSVCLIKFFCVVWRP